MITHQRCLSVRTSQTPTLRPITLSDFTFSRCTIFSLGAWPSTYCRTDLRSCGGCPNVSCGRSVSATGGGMTHSSGSIWSFFGLGCRDATIVLCSHRSSAHYDLCYPTTVLRKGCRLNLIVLHLFVRRVTKRTQTILLFSSTPLIAGYWVSSLPERPRRCRGGFVFRHGAQTNPPPSRHPLGRPRFTAVCPPFCRFKNHKRNRARMISMISMISLISRKVPT